MIGIKLRILTAKKSCEDAHCLFVLTNFIIGNSTCRYLLPNVQGRLFLIKQWVIDFRNQKNCKTWPQLNKLNNKFLGTVNKIFILNKTLNIFADFKKF